MKFKDQTVTLPQEFKVLNHISRVLQGYDEFCELLQSAKSISLGYMKGVFRCLMPFVSCKFENLTFLELKLNRQGIELMSEILSLTSVDYRTKDDKLLESKLNSEIGRMINLIVY